MQRRTIGSIMSFVAAAALATACGSAAPQSAEKRASLEQDAQQTLQAMRARDPSIDKVLASSVGYIVFPTVGQGGAIVGGAHGRGIVYENGQVTGYAVLNQASVGAQLGGQTFSELVIFHNQRSLQNVKRTSSFDLSGQASAVILGAGPAAAARIGREPVSVLISPKRGAMVNFSIAGQTVKFQPRG